MIDTIIIRLHNIDRYNTILNFLLDSSKQEFGEAYATIPKNCEETLIHLQHARYEFRGKRVVNTNGDLLTSSHYKLHWTMPISDNPDYVEFNFSVPKLLYGTNILQFVQHETEYSKGFDFVNNAKYGYNVEQTYKRFVHFIRMFFDKYIPYTGETINMRDVEISRIDICFNQLFNSKAEALEYLSYQKSIRKKHLRQTSDVKIDRPSSLYFNTRDYGAKVYHKGMEYASRQGEKKHHLEINRKKGKKIFDTDILQRLADRTLRYEITFRNSYMSKIYRTKIFRRKNEHWQKKMKRFKEIRRIYTYANSKTLNEEKRNYYYHCWIGKLGATNKNFEYHAKRLQFQYRFIDMSKGLDKKDRLFYEWWSKVKERRIDFRMEVSQRVSDLNVGVHLDELERSFDKNGNEHLPETAKVSRRLFYEMFKIFNKFRDYYKVKELSALSDTKRKLIAYNEKVKMFNQLTDSSAEQKDKKINQGRILQIIALLQNKSLDKLIEDGVICRKTAYNYKKIFEKLELNLQGGSVVHIPNDRTFEWYHQALTFDNMERYTKNRVFF